MRGGKTLIQTPILNQGDFELCRFPVIHRDSPGERLAISDRDLSAQRLESWSTMAPDLGESPPTLSPEFPDNLVHGKTEWYSLSKKVAKIPDHPPRRLVAVTSSFIGKIQDAVSGPVERYNRGCALSY
jgi:hypothetical protein